MKSIPVILYGAGGVGGALLRQIVHGRERVASRSKCQFEVVAVTDTTSWRWAPQGLADSELLAIVERKAQGLPAADPDPDQPRPSDHAILDAAGEAGLDGAVVVDVTAAAGMESILKHALNLGYGVTLANKKPLAGQWESAAGFFDHSRVRYESTVGGGQPVIATLRYLLDVNDPIHEIEGQMSGTLGFICQQLDAGVPFSTAVRTAKEKGFTEPDPREDLSGMDVMRKVLILARTAGWSLAVKDIEVESLYAPEMGRLSVPEFMAAAGQLDAALQKRVAQAAAEGKVLRYVAEVQSRGGTVGLKAIPAASGLADLKYISFRTERYDDEALLIGGKGAGVEMTAAGVLGDMIALVREG